MLRKLLASGLVIVAVAVCTAAMPGMLDSSTSKDCPLEQIPLEGAGEKFFIESACPDAC